MENSSRFALSQAIICQISFLSGYKVQIRFSCPYASADVNLHVLQIRNYCLRMTIQLITEQA